jgi:hypothetical protein
MFLKTDKVNITWMHIVAAKCLDVSQNIIPEHAA